MRKIFILSFACFVFEQSAIALCVKVNTANLRSGPSTNYPKSWEVYKYMPFKKIKKKGKWLQVQDVDGHKHWVFSKLVTSKFKCAVIKVKKANLRTGPGKRYPQSVVYPTADKYESFKIAERKKGWVLLEDMDGDKVWVFKSLIWSQ